jgi:hypothetical protein
VSRLSQFIKRLKATRCPVRARHIEPSFLISIDDDPATPDDVLFDISLKAIDLARRINLEDIARRAIGQAITCWPGEHYRLLSAIVQVLDPKTVIEIGTATGASALAMLKFMASGTHLYTPTMVKRSRMASDLQDLRFIYTLPISQSKRLSQSSPSRPIHCFKYKTGM